MSLRLPVRVQCCRLVAPAAAGARRGPCAPVARGRRTDAASSAARPWRCCASGGQARQGDGDAQRAGNAQQTAGGHARVEESLAAAEQACSADAVQECAAAWEEVLQMRVANADADEDAARLVASVPAHVGAGLQARRLVDPLQSVRPASVPGTLPPEPGLGLAGVHHASGSLAAAQALERTMRAPAEAQSAAEAGASAARRASTPPPPVEVLAARVKDAVETCEKGTPVDCAVAWDEVEELSATRDKRKQRPPPE